jgi:hypothetical protein
MPSFRVLQVFVNMVASLPLPRHASLSSLGTNMPGLPEVLMDVLSSLTD